MLHDLRWDVHVVGSIDQPWHAGFDHCTLHHLSRSHPAPIETATRRVVAHAAAPWTGDIRQHRAATIARLIDTIRPDVVHSHELQHAAYTTLMARDLCTEPFPAWIVTSWGSDLYFHARDDHHRRAIELVLRHADGFGAECSRDVALARAAGFRGRAVPVVPVSGGHDLVATQAMRIAGPTSARTAIAVKGYQHRFGRALTALDALDVCGDLLAGREVIVYAPSNADVIDRARRLVRMHHAGLTVIDDVPNDEIIRMHGRARVAIGLSISDGASSCFLEALLGGAFPVQSFTACASEWTVDGSSALHVDPTSLSGVAAAIRRALTDDALVDRARKINDRTVAIRLDRANVLAATALGYREVVVAHSLAAVGV